MFLEILTNAQMEQAERLTMAAGRPGFMLMEKAGEALAGVIRARYPNRKILVLCGPGNNGGDGFVAARVLKEGGSAVRVACLVPADKLKGDAQWAAESWHGGALTFDHLIVAPDEVIVDAIFGTGFARALEEPVVSLFGHIREQRNEVIAADIPSGVNGTTGEADPKTLRANATVTFFRKKVGHVLMPGAALCGEVVVTDIGIDDKMLADTGIAARENGPALWRARLKPKDAAENKYDHGHVLVYGGGRMTGAACMAAHAALRVGAGLCTLSSPIESSVVYRGYLPNIIVEERARPGAFMDELADKRRNAVLIGPGAGRENEAALRKNVLGLCADGRACVIDADALTIFAEHRDSLYRALGNHCVLTPHEGEFKRIFPDIEGVKTERVAQAAKRSGAIVLLKGADTVIAAPDGRVVVNTMSSPDLGTGGSGDVLAGLITGLLARGLPPFEAACAGAWLHGRAAQLFGAGLMASDLPEQIPAVLKELFALPEEITVTSTAPPPTLSSAFPTLF